MSKVIKDTTPSGRETLDMILSGGLKKPTRQLDTGVLLLRLGFFHAFTAFLPHV